MNVGERERWWTERGQGGLSGFIGFVTHPIEAKSLPFNYVGCPIIRKYWIYKTLVSVKKLRKHFFRCWSWWRELLPLK